MAEHAEKKLSQPPRRILLRGELVEVSEIAPEIIASALKTARTVREVRQAIAERKAARRG